MVGRVVKEESFLVNHDKTSLRTTAQRQLVTGVVVNAHANVPRPEYDRLKAVLHRIAVDGPGAYDPGRSVDRQSQLRGQVAWVNAVNPRRGQKLHRILDTINWDPVNRPDP
jgi:RNA-directed DNA polymerase